MYIGYKILSSFLDEKRNLEIDENSLLSFLKEDGNSLGSLDSIQGPIDYALFFVMSGGTEEKFLSYTNLKCPFGVVSFGKNNSLAASLEIMTYCRQNSLQGTLYYELTDNTKQEILQKIRILSAALSLKGKRIGLLGRPSNWLIASHIEKSRLKDVLGIELYEYDLKEVFSRKEKLTFNDAIFPFPQKESEIEEYRKSKEIYLTLKEFIEENAIDAFSIRCFDLLFTLKATSCLALSYMNDQQISCSCEGDIPSLVSMMIISELFHMPSFQANPSRIDLENSCITFAHCTIPLGMMENYEFNTHFESQAHLAIQGILPKGPVTIFRLASNIKDYSIIEAEVVDTQFSSKMCRTQANIHVPNVQEFLTNPVGNHQIIFYGHHKKELEDFMRIVLKDR